MSDPADREAFTLAAMREVRRRTRVAEREVNPAAGSAQSSQQRRRVASGWDAALAAVLKRQGGNEP